MAAEVLKIGKQFRHPDACRICIGKFYRVYVKMMVCISFYTRCCWKHILSLAEYVTENKTERPCRVCSGKILREQVMVV